MDANKTIILRAFNKLFFEFIDDIISIYPDNVEMLSARDSFLTVKQLNPTSIAKVWYSGVYSPYKLEIESGNLDFFTEKDYSSDLSTSNVTNLQTVLSMIDKVRDPIKQMTMHNKELVTKYIQNISKLANAYALIG